MLPDKDDGRFQELGGEGFTFTCNPEVPCFNECCRQLRLVLTPYDVLRLKEHLGLNSGEFIDRYTVVENGLNGWPMPRLKMSEGAEATCPFVSEAGCTVYPDRPGACRTYPLGRAARGGQAYGVKEQSYFLVREAHCRGFEKGDHWTPETWNEDQGLEAYNATNDLFLPLITRQAPAADAVQAQKKMQMFFMACFNLDAFKKFVTESRLTELIEIDPTRRELILTNDLQLLKFAFDWLRFSLFGEQTLKLK